MFTFLHHRQGGSTMGNFFRRLVNHYTGGISDALGLTDNHATNGTDPGSDGRDFI